MAKYENYQSLSQKLSLNEQNQDTTNQFIAKNINSLQKDGIEDNNIQEIAHQFMSTNDVSNSSLWVLEPDQVRKLSMEDFQVIAILGFGSFGVVKLAKHINSGSYVAIKVLSKELIVEMRQEKLILRERSVHLMLDHAFITRLYGTFQDDDCLYLVLEYVPGGELESLVYPNGHHEEHTEDSGSEIEDNISEQGEPTSNEDSLQHESKSRHQKAQVLLSKRDCTGPMDAKIGFAKLRSSYGGLQEEVAAFYLACILLSLEHVHEQNLLYRDLKLENLVLDAKGYPKMIDFGFAKLNDGEGRNKTMCGSAEYMAPEFLRHEAHDQRADIWSYGIIAYELLFGVTPFHDVNKNPRQVSKRILSDEVSYPPQFKENAPEAYDLIQKLLVKDQDQRIASLSELKSHAFFKKNNFPTSKSWIELCKKQKKAPLIPMLSGSYDISFFRQHGRDSLSDESVEPYYDDGSNVFQDF